MRARRSVRSASALAGLLLAAALALTGCSAESGGGSSDKAAAGAARSQAHDGSGGGAPGGGGGRAAGAKAGASPKLDTGHIIRTASLTIEVADVAKALGAARTAAENAGGYVGDETTSRDEDGHEETHVVLRVPAQEYDGVLAGLQGAGKLVERTAKAQDVTDQVVDVDSRIKSQRASVARVRALMDKAERIGDVVTLEGELSRREADLEALLAQQASLKDRTGLATITLSLSGAATHKAADTDDGPGFGDALTGGWHVFVTVVRWLALALGAVLPFAVAAALVVVVWRAVRSRLPRRPAPDGPAGTGPAERMPARPDGAAGTGPAEPAAGQPGGDPGGRGAGRRIG
ncbi:DUF4349 domain-containing protein [Streptomyces sp. NPDC015220]|uniref:DUF4349 domain-containing protein n=1 Tax=Streptomyces sp. NPDC015220 TaxID=3364947 RepID=UPI0037004F6F